MHCRHWLYASLRLVASSGNIVTDQELEQDRKKGAVGEICFQVIDVHGKPIHSPLAQRVIGINLNELKRAGRIVGIVGVRRRLRQFLLL